MPRQLSNWLTEFQEYTAWGEAPPRVYFWVGVATIASALRRRVWLDMGGFTWIPNLYVLLVGPPAVIAKSTSIDQGLNLLKKVPGILFGQNSGTWQGMLDALEEAHEGVMWNNEMLEMSSLCADIGEFGTFLNPKDTQQIDHLVHIWDGKDVKKRLRGTGEQYIKNPCLNIISGTTPDWIAQNVPRYMVGGGLTSRMLFIYADKKARYNAYPFLAMPSDHKARRQKLIDDLEAISKLVGPFTLTKEALAWGSAWYENFHRNEAPKLDSTLIGGYVSRKQVLTHKVAMALSVAESDSLVIEARHLEQAIALTTALEPDMPLVYSRIGLTEESQGGMQIVEFLKRAGGAAPYQTVYRYMHRLFPTAEEFNKILLGLKESGQIRIEASGPNKGLLSIV